MFIQLSESCEDDGLVVPPDVPLANHLDADVHLVADVVEILNGMC